MKTVSFRSQLLRYLLSSMFVVSMIVPMPGMLAMNEVDHKSKVDQLQSALAFKHDTALPEEDVNSNRAEAETKRRVSEKDDSDSEKEELVNGTATFGNASVDNDPFDRPASNQAHASIAVNSWRKNVLFAGFFAAVAAIGAWLWFSNRNAA